MQYIYVIAETHPDKEKERREIYGIYEFCVAGIADFIFNH